MLSLYAMGYICPYCGEGLPDDEECPYQAIGDDLDIGSSRSSAKRQQDQRRRDQMRANGPVERFTVAEIGERDGWLCGICGDTARPVDPARGRPDPLSASIDHIVPVAAGGTHTRANVQIAHWFCNQEKNASARPRPIYMRALLARQVDGTPIPEEVHRGRYPSWAYPASRQVESMIALKIAAGDIALSLRYGDPATRLERFVRDFGEDAVRAQLARMKERRRRRARGPMSAAG